MDKIMDSIDVMNKKNLDGLLDLIDKSNEESMEI